MKKLLGALALLLLAAPATAQTTTAPLLSLQRVSVGFRAEYVYYRPTDSLLGMTHSGEFKVGIPIAYNLGRFSSLGVSARYGLDSKVKELSAGVTLHLLARGKTP